MSDSAEEFARKTKAMLDGANARIDQIAKGFLCNIVFTLVTTTPGPGNQLAGTLYDATGRLRGAWRVEPAQLFLSTRWEGGPYDAGRLGEATVDAIKGEIMAAELLPTYYLNNDVAYNYLVNIGTHKMPARRYVFDAALTQYKALSAALATPEEA